MIKFVALLLLAFAVDDCRSGEDITVEEARKTLSYLASDEMEGRKPGNPGNFIAVSFIKKEFESYGLETHLQKFTYPFRWRVGLFRWRTVQVETMNVIGVLKGTSDKHVVIGAHMDHLGIDRAVLGGMSQGGFLTLRAALTAPARVRAMVLVDTEAEALSGEDRTHYQALFDAAIAMGLSGEVGDALEMVLFAPGYADARYWRGKWASKPITAWMGAKDCLFERDSIVDRLGEITCPSIVFHGDADMAIPLERGRLVSDSLSGSSTFVVVPGAGHTSNLEAPAVVNPALLDFLAAFD